jgi:hypothetical protein
VVGVLASWLAFGELIDAVEIIAGALVVGGVLFASLRPRRRGGAGLESRADEAPTVSPPGERLATTVE